MKKILLLLVAGLAVVSCQNKELGELPSSRSVNVRINWTEGLTRPTNEGMRINLFSLDEGRSHYGMSDVEYTGCKVNLSCGTKHRTFAYTYRGNNIYFRNQLDPNLIEAYCAPMTRATYSRSFPQEQTVAEPQGNFYVGEHPNYTVLEEEDQYIDVTPDNKLYTYYFEVRGIKGAEFIAETRGAISGMSSSYFLSSGTLSTYPATVLFTAMADRENDMIKGSFMTFGRLDTNNNFTIEILYPSNEDGIVQYTWDVTDQIEDDNSFTIIIDGSDIEIPDEGGELSGGWKVIVDDWEDQTVVLQ